MQSAEALCREYFARPEPLPDFARLLIELITKSSDALVRQLRPAATLQLSTFEAFVDDFSAWKGKVIKKAYKDDHLIGQVYRDSMTFGNEQEYTQYCRCEIEIAYRCLRDIREEIGNDQRKCDAYRHHIADYIFDLSPFVEHFERKTDPSYHFIEGWKSNMDSSVTLYRATRDLFWSSTATSENPMEHRYALNLSAFALRQALEVRFQRAIGIAAIIGPTGQRPKLRHDFIWDFVQTNSDLIQTNVVSMIDLAKIYKWTNFSIHSGILPKIWEIQFAIKQCKTLFQPEPLDAMGRWNIYSSIKITDYATVKARFEAAVNVECQNVAWLFIWMDRPEALVS